MCTLLRRSRIEYGSEAASAEIKLEVLRTARLNEEPKLQGYHRNDRNVKIGMEVEIGSEEKFTDLYWIVQRQHVVQEGESVCPTSKTKCYTSTKRRQKNSTSPNTFEIELEVDVLTDTDIEEPVVLVKDFRNRNGDDVIDIFFVPKTSDRDEERDDVNERPRDVDLNDRNSTADIKRKRLNKNNRTRSKQGYTIFSFKFFLFKAAIL